MAQASVDELLKRCSSMYKLVVLAAKRAKEISDGAPPLVESEHKKVTSIALEEIRQGKVQYKYLDAPAAEGSKKGKGRAAKTKDKKRVTA